MFKKFILIYFITLSPSVAYAQQYMDVEPPFLFRLFSNSFFTFLFGLLFIALMISWTFLPFAIFGIKKDLNKIEKNTQYLDKLVRLLEEKECEKQD